MSAGARDSQRTSDLNQINQQVMTTQAKNGMSYMSMVSGYGNSLSDASISGTGTASGASYAGGNVNYTALGVDSAKFSDPVSKAAYRMGATTLAGTAYELAAKLEETSTALVMGTYRARGATTSATLATSVPVSGNNIGVFASADIGKFRAGDTVTVTGGAPGVNVIKSISGDGLSFTLTSTNTATGTALVLTAESAGLIASSGSTLSANAVTNGGAKLPY